jgi:hypothetical protein
MNTRNRRIAVAAVVVVVLGGAVFFLGHPRPHKPVHHVLPVAAATPTPTPGVPPTLKAAVTAAKTGTPILVTASGLTPGRLGVFIEGGVMVYLCRANRQGTCSVDLGNNSPSPRTFVVTDVASALESQSLTLTFTGAHIHSSGGLIPQSGPGAKVDGLWWGDLPAPTLKVASAMATVGSTDKYVVGNVVPGLEYAIWWGPAIDGQQAGTSCMPTSGSHTCVGTFTAKTAGVRRYSGVSAKPVAVTWISPGASTP